MQFNFQSAIESLVANGAEMVADGSFVNDDGQPFRIRTGGQYNDPFAAGDEVSFPDPLVVMKQDIEGRKYPFALVHVVARTKEERDSRIFPNGTFAKSIIPLDENDKPGSRVEMSGPVVRWYKEQSNMDVAMKKLAGRTIVCTNVRVYRSIVNGTKKDVYLYDWDWKDKAAE